MKTGERVPSLRENSMFEKIKNAASDYGRKIRSVDCMILGENVKIVIATLTNTYEAVLFVNGTAYPDAFNAEEPFDRRTHVFYVPAGEFCADTKLRMEVKTAKKLDVVFHYDFVYGTPVYPTEKELAAKYDNGLRILYEEKETLTDGVEYFHKVYNDKKGKAVHVFYTVVDPEKACVYVGTPNDGYESVGVQATIPDMIASAEKNGRNIIAAVNADFFDMFGDHHPSGLCMKNGKIVANENSPRPFIALLHNGTHIISDVNETPFITTTALHAAAGMQMIVKDGKVNDFAPLESFGYTRHPRTAVGVKKDGSVILAVADGRIPDYSNGASLVDLAKLMISYGADRALNMDGGGSSAMYTKVDGKFILRSRPADLFRPNAMLIRKDYNSLLVEKK